MKSTTSEPRPAVQVPPPDTDAIRRRSAGYIAMAVAVAALLYVGMTVEVLAAPLGLVTAGAVLALAPSSTHLSGRIALNGSIFIGCLPLLWWIRWPVELSHMGLALSIAGGALTKTLLSAHRSGHLATYVPRVSKADLAVPVGAAVAVASIGKWLAMDSAQSALTALLRGADNYGHFDMFATIRHQGALLTFVQSAPDGSRWAYYNYPQGFHGLAASLSELVTPHVDANSDLLVSYCRSVGLVVALTTIVLTAAVASVPSLRDRPALLLPTLTVAWMAFLVEPGQKILLDGFANFWLGAAVAATALVIPLASVRSPVVLTTAVGSMLLTCAHTWLPLAVFAAPTIFAVVPSIRGSFMDTRRRVLTVLVAVCATTGFGVAALDLFTTVSVNYVVTTKSGGLNTTSPIPLLVLVILGLVACLFLAHPQPVWSLPSSQLRRLRLVSLASPLGFLVLLLLGAVQARALGQLTYYSIKYAMGFELVLATLVPLVLAIIWSQVAPKQLPWAGIATATLLAAAATQSFGTFPRGPLPLWSGDPTLGTAAFDRAMRPGPVARGILKAVKASNPEDTFNVDYLALGNERAAEAFYPDAWFHAIQHSLSQHVFDRYAILRTPLNDRRQAARTITRLLRRNETTRVLVTPEAAGIRHRLPIDVSGRLLTAQRFADLSDGS